MRGFARKKGILILAIVFALLCAGGVLGPALRPQENRLIVMPGYDSSVVRDCRGDLVSLSMVNYDLGREDFEKAAFAVVNTARGPSGSRE